MSQDMNDLALFVSNHIDRTPIGERVKIQFSGVAVPIAVRIAVQGGWVFEYTIIPGMTLEFVRGEPYVLEQLDITILPHEGLK